MFFLWAKIDIILHLGVIFVQEYAIFVPKTSISSVWTITTPIFAHPRYPISSENALLCSVKQKLIIQKMKVKSICLSIASLLLPSLLLAQKSSMEPWQNPEVNEVNRMAAHADFMNKNEWRMSLHGVWGEMPIPGMWEMNGLGEPMYAGQNYEWKTWWKSNPPALPDSANYCYTYVRKRT